MASRGLETFLDNQFCKGERSMADELAQTVGAVAGGVMGAKAGAAVGTLVCPGVGTVLGAVVGAVAGASVAHRTRGPRQKASFQLNRYAGRAQAHPEPCLQLGHGSSKCVRRTGCPLIPGVGKTVRAGRSKNKRGSPRMLFTFSSTARYWGHQPMRAATFRSFATATLSTSAAGISAGSAERHGPPPAA